MQKDLGIVQLRSLVAIADLGSFQRAANSLHLSQGAVSQHVRRLEDVVGRPLVKRQGRGSRFTPDGEKLVRQAREILDAHDEALRLIGMKPPRGLAIGLMEHGADQLLPQLQPALLETMPEKEIRFRVDHGKQLSDDLAQGRIDLILLFNNADREGATPVGHLNLSWYATPAWSNPDGHAVPLVVEDHSCSPIRDRALETLDNHGLGAEVTAGASYLAGVVAAARAGLGVALMATEEGRTDGLVPVSSLPSPQPMRLTLLARRGLAGDVSEDVARVLRGLVSTVTALSSADDALDERGVTLQHD